MRIFKAAADWCGKNARGLAAGILECLADLLIASLLRLSFAKSLPGNELVKLFILFYLAIKLRRGVVKIWVAVAKRSKPVAVADPQ